MIGNRASRTRNETETPARMEFVSIGRIGNELKCLRTRPSARLIFHFLVGDGFCRKRERRRESEGYGALRYSRVVCVLNKLRIKCETNENRRVRTCGFWDGLVRWKLGTFFGVLQALKCRRKYVCTGSVSNVCTFHYHFGTHAPMVSGC